MKYRLRTLKKTLLLIVVLVCMSPAPLLVGSVKAAPYVNNRSLKINSSIPGATGVNYEFSFDAPDMPALGAIKLSLCSNSPLPEVTCDGFTGSGMSTLSTFSLTGATGFSISGSPTQTEVLLSRAAQPISAGQIVITLQNITNPNAPGPYFGRIELFSDSAAATPAEYVGGTAIVINQPIDISTYVPPYLYFCVAISISGVDCSNPSDDYYDFGEFSSHYTSTAQSQFTTATNAGFGYNVTCFGNTMTSGNNIVSPLSSLSNSSVGHQQFGLNLRRNNSPGVGDEPTGYGPYPTINANYNQPDRYIFNSGDQLVSINRPSYFTKYTVSYIVNIDSAQPPGVYSTTMLYLALANF